MMNILILSCGTRNKIVQYFCRTVMNMGGCLVAADCSLLAPALYEADKYFIIPRIDEVGYLGAVLDICKKESITGVISLIDPELSILAKHVEQFQNIHTKVIGSSYGLCELSFDKYEMYKWLNKHKYRCAKSFIDNNLFFDEVESKKIYYPVMIKPARGSASIGISKAEDNETVNFFMNRDKNMMIQEYLDGQEIGADVYVDLISGEVVSIFTKKKIKMRAGETDKAISFKDEDLFDFIVRFVEDMGYRGPVDIDLFEINGEYYISEVNPRFGGGYPHAYECGVDHMKMIAENLMGRENKKNIGGYESDIYAMKYSEIVTRTISD